jgi:hypothetical protein
MPQVQVHGTTGNTAAQGSARYSNGATGPAYIFAKSRNASIAGQTVVQLNDTLGIIHFNGSDGTNFVNGAFIEGRCTGTPGTTDMPASLLFFTSPDGSATPTERLRISDTGFVSVTGCFGTGAPVTKTGNFTLAATENNVIINNGASTTVTLPAASSFTGREVTFKTIQAQTLVSASSNVVLRTDTATGTGILAATDGAWATIVSDGTNWVLMAGTP